MYVAVSERGRFVHQIDTNRSTKPTDISISCPSFTSRVDKRGRLGVRLRLPFPCAVRSFVFFPFLSAPTHRTASFHSDFSWLSSVVGDFKST